MEGDISVCRLATPDGYVAYSLPLGCSLLLSTAAFDTPMIDAGGASRRTPRRLVRG